MTRLKDEQTVIVNLGENALTITNLVEEDVRIYVDHQLANGDWSAITGERRLAGGAIYERTPAELGHERVRVGVRGPEDGRDLVEVRP
jgi:hypothetical protein